MLSTVYSYTKMMDWGQTTPVAIWEADYSLQVTQNERLSTGYSCSNTRARGQYTAVAKL